MQISWNPWGNLSFVLCLLGFSKRSSEMPSGYCSKLCSEKITSESIFPARLLRKQTNSATALRWGFQTHLGPFDVKLLFKRKETEQERWKARKLDPAMDLCGESNSATKLLIGKKMFFSLSCRFPRPFVDASPRGKQCSSLFNILRNEKFSSIFPYFRWNDMKEASKGEEKNSGKVDDNPSN